MHLTDMPSLWWNMYTAMFLFDSKPTKYQAQLNLIAVCVWVLFWRARDVCISNCFILQNVSHPTYTMLWLLHWVVETSRKRIETKEKQETGCSLLLRNDSPFYESPLHLYLWRQMRQVLFYFSSYPKFLPVKSPLCFTVVHLYLKKQDRP